MRLFNLKGRPINKEVSKYLIKWDKKSRSKIQFKTKQFLKKFWATHIVYEEFPVFGSLMKVDILNATKKISVEVQGDQHEEYNEFFHGGSKHTFYKSLQRDSKKLAWLEKNGYQLIEIKEDEVELLSRAFIKEKFGIDIV